MKIKIIDLLKMKLNDNLPKEIFFEKHQWILAENEADYWQGDEEKYTVWLFEEYIPSNFDLLNILNNEVEIIEEEKKIEFLRTATNDKVLVEFKDKINEVIDAVNKLKVDD